MKRRLFLHRLTAIFVFSSLVIIQSFAQKFTIPVLPDTQREVNFNQPMLTSQMKWMADHKDSLNIPIVLHVGDVVDYNNNTHYQIASEAFQILDDSKLPYAIAPGNHDTSAARIDREAPVTEDQHTKVRVTDKFNRYFPVKRFPLQKGRFEKNKSDNVFYVFKAGGLKWLVLTLEFCSRPEPVKWAGKIILKHPNHNVIVLTHSHLTSQGEISQVNSGYGDLSPRQIFDQMISLYPNVLMVLSGHVGKSAHRVDNGANGNPIYQILQDYQGEDNGGGYIRFLEIDTEAKTISAKMFSPFYMLTKNDDSQFILTDIDFIGSKR